MSHSPVNLLSTPLTISVEAMTSTLGQSSASFYTAIATGISTVSHKKELTVQSQEKRYEQGILVSEIPELKQLDRETRIRLLLSSLELDDVEPLPLLVQLPKLKSKTEHIVNDSLRGADEFSELEIISEADGIIEIVNLITQKFKTGSYNSLYLLVADSSVDLSYLVNQSNVSALAEPANPRGYIASEGAVLLKISIGDVSAASSESSISLTAGLAFDGISTKAESVKALSHLVTALCSSNALQSPTSESNDNSGDKQAPLTVINVDNSAFKLEEQWAGVRLTLPDHLKNNISQQPIYPSRLSGVAGNAHFWLSFAYLQGLKQFPLNHTHELLLLEATRPQVRVGFRVNLKNNETYTRKAV